MAFSLSIIEERKFEMKKYLLLSGLFAVLTYSSAHAQGYYYESGGYYDDQPAQYIEVEPIKKAPRYHRITNSEEKRVYRGESISNKIKPYIGLDIAVSKIKLGDEEDLRKDEYSKYFEDTTKSISGIIGAKINKNFGFEAYYQQSDKKNKEKQYVGTGRHEGAMGSFNFDYTTKTSLSYKSYGVDFTGYIPLTQEVELLAALGLGQYDFEAKAVFRSSLDDSVIPLADGCIGCIVGGNVSRDFDSFGVRLGVGAQYNFNDHFALRGIFRYIKMTESTYVKNLIEASLGLRYMF